MGLEPGTTRAEVRKCLENWNRGDNGILDLSRAYRLKPGTGWLIGPGVLHAPGSLCTYEPQWGSDVFGMYQSLVEGREVPWELLVKDMPKKKHRDLDFIVDQLDWEANVDTRFKKKCRDAFNERVAEAQLIMVSHSENTLRSYCGTALLLENGTATYFDDLEAALEVYGQLAAA